MGPARPRLRLHEPHIAGGADAIGHRGRPRSGLGRLTVVLVVAWLGVMIGWPFDGLKMLFVAIINTVASTWASIESGKCTAI